MTHSKDIEGYECTGYTCNHETAEQHYIFGIEAIKSFMEKAEKRGAEAERGRLMRVFKTCVRKHLAPEHILRKIMDAITNPI